MPGGARKTTRFPRSWRSSQLGHGLRSAAAAAASASPRASPRGFLSPIPAISFPLRSPPPPLPHLEPLGALQFPLFLKCRYLDKRQAMKVVMHSRCRDVFRFLPWLTGSGGFFLFPGCPLQICL